MIQKLDNGRYLLDIRPNGKKGERVRKVFNTKRAALAYEKGILANKNTSISEIKSDNRRLSDLITLWFDVYGCTLKSAIDTKNRLLALSTAVNNPLVDNLNTVLFVEYRKQRLDSGINPSTLNRELVTLRAVFNELNRLGYWDKENPVENIKRFSEEKKELSYLTNSQIEQLLEQTKVSRNLSLYCVVTLCLATGARWSEAENLKLHHLTKQGVQFIDTKNGSNRFVPVHDKLLVQLKDYLQKYAAFESCYSAFSSALERTGIKTPAGQRAHILRHTFASHFIMQGGNILVLQKILGHSTLQMTMRYSHFAPNYLQEAIIYNPLSFD